METKFLGKLGNSKLFSAQNQVVSKKKSSSPKLSLIFWPKSEIQSFFPPKIRWSPKKKKKWSSPKLKLIFRPNSEIQTFEGICFPTGWAIFNFSQKILIKSIKNVRFCILPKPMGGGSSPPAPPLATLLLVSCSLFSLQQVRNQDFAEVGHANRLIRNILWPINDKNFVIKLAVGFDNPISQPK